MKGKSMKVPNGLRFSEFRGYAGWQTTEYPKR
jgi:hypothetical protein